MMFCNICGQSPYLGDDQFIENRNTYGWEVAYLNPHNGDTEDWGNSETTDSDHSSYECPYCRSDDVDFDTDMTEEDAIDLRNTYDADIRARRIVNAEQEKLREYEKQAKDPKRQWDVETNV